MRNYNNRNQKNSNRSRKNSGGKSFNPMRTQLDSNGVAGRIRGTAAQIAEKYTAIAIEVRAGGDRIKAEELFQMAEHYNRLIIEHKLANPIIEKESSNADDQKKHPKSIEETKEETAVESPPSLKLEDLTATVAENINSDDINLADSKQENTSSK